MSMIEQTRKDCARIDHRLIGANGDLARTSIGSGRSLLDGMGDELQWQFMDFLDGMRSIW